jgi:hypothetical protein
MSSIDSTEKKPRDLRDNPLVRVGILVAVLAVAFLFARGCQEEARPVSSERAVELARAEVSFTPDRYQVRFVQRGIPARGYWGVSFVEEAGRRAGKGRGVLVDAPHGRRHAHRRLTTRM